MRFDLRFVLVFCVVCMVVFVIDGVEAVPVCASGSVCIEQVTSQNLFCDIVVDDYPTSVFSRVATAWGDGCLWEFKGTDQTCEAGRGVDYVSSPYLALAYIPSTEVWWSSSRFTGYQDRDGDGYCGGEAVDGFPSTSGYGVAVYEEPGYREVDVTGSLAYDDVSKEIGGSFNLDGQETNFGFDADCVGAEVAVSFNANVLDIAGCPELEPVAVSCNNDPQCDDGNPCTDDTCPAGTCVNTPVADYSTPGIEDVNNPNDPDNCRGSAGICKKYKCKSGKCQALNSPRDTDCRSDVNVCRKNVCGGSYDAFGLPEAEGNGVCLPYLMGTWDRSADMIAGSGFLTRDGFVWGDEYEGWGLPKDPKRLRVVSAVRGKSCSDSESNIFYKDYKTLRLADVVGGPCCAVTVCPEGVHPSVEIYPQTRYQCIDSFDVTSLGASLAAFSAEKCSNINKAGKVCAFKTYFRNPVPDGGDSSGPFSDGRIGGPVVPAGNVWFSCGDGVVNGNEICDDGNIVDGDGCSSKCIPEIVCGNGIREGNEECDGAGVIVGNSCLANCVLGEERVGCGDGNKVPPEECDDNNLVSGDGCSSKCFREYGPDSTWPRYCGDWIRDAEEECDGGLGCLSDCTIGSDCWNGIADGAGACDLGDDNGGDLCDINCQPKDAMFVYWQDALGEVIGGGGVVYLGQTVYLIAEGVDSGIFEIKEKNFVGDDDEIKSVVGVSVGNDLIGEWEIKWDDLAKSLGDYDNFYFVVDEKQSVGIKVSLDGPGVDEVDVEIELPACGAWFDEGSEVEIKIPEVDLGENGGSLHGNVSIVGYPKSYFVGEFDEGGGSFVHWFKVPGNFQIVADVVSDAGVKGRSISSVMILELNEEEEDGKYVVDKKYTAACISKPKDYSYIKSEDMDENGGVYFDASGTKGIEINGGGEIGFLGASDISNWYWDFEPSGISKIYSKSLGEGAYKFYVHFPTAGMNSAKLRVEIDS